MKNVAVQLDIDHLATVEEIVKKAPFAGACLRLDPLVSDAKRYADAVCEVDVRLGVREYHLPEEMRQEMHRRIDLWLQPFADHVFAERAKNLIQECLSMKGKVPAYLLSDEDGLDESIHATPDETLSALIERKVNPHVEAYLKAHGEKDD